MDAIEAASEICVGLSQKTEGGAGNFRFCASFRCPPGVPFFPSAYAASNSENFSFALGFECGDVFLTAMKTLANSTPPLTAATVADAAAEGAPAAAGEVVVVAAAEGEPKSDDEPMSPAPPSDPAPSSSSPRRKKSEAASATGSGSGARARIMPLEQVRAALSAAFIEVLTPLEALATELAASARAEVVRKNEDGEVVAMDADEIQKGSEVLYNGIDASMNPGLEDGYSVAEAMEVALGGRSFGRGGTLAMSATITAVLKSLPVKLCG